MIAIGEYGGMVPFLALLAAMICIIGRKMGMQKLEKLFFPLLSEEKKKSVATLKKKFIIVTVIVFVATVGLHVLSLNIIPESATSRYERQEDFARFVSEKEGYDKQREAAIQKGAELVNTPDSMVNRMTVEHAHQENQTAVFHLVGDFENVIEIDAENMTVVSKVSDLAIAQTQSALNRLFLGVYFVEILFMGALYFIQRRRIVTGQR